MARNTKTPRGRVVAVIALVLRTIAKKDVHRRAMIDLGALNGRKKHKTDTSESL